MTATASTPMPPGPALPRFLQTLGFILVPARFIDACRRRYGEVVTFSSLFDSGFVMVFEPELVKQVFRGSPEVLRAGEANAVLGPVVGARSVLLLDGAEHLRERKLMLPAFHGEQMRAYADVIREAADRSIESWPVGEPFTLLPQMQALTLDVIMRAVFGVDAGPRQEELKARIRALLDPVTSRVSVLMLALSGGRSGAGAGRRFEQSRQVLDELIYQEISRRRAEDLDERQDVLSMLLLARGEDGRSMTDHELRDELVTLLVAGHETTATGLAWAFELLLRTPRVLERLGAELAEGGGDYLEAVVKETLRLRPVIMSVGRVVRGKPFELGGYLIPPGVEINPSIATIHRREDRYPDARAFRPERFVGPDGPDTYTWLPFGGGTRRCLGASFATFEMQVVIRRVLERTNLETVGRRPEKGVRRGITFVPAAGVRVRLAASPAGASAHSAIGVGTPTLSRASLPCPPNSVDPKWKEASMLTLSPSAVDAVDSLLHGPEVPDDAGLRICTSGESQLTLEIAPEPAPGDQVIEEGGARVFVDSEAAPMLDTAELDARTEGDQVAFDLTPTGGNNSSVTGE